jgi:hypothetical protein
MISPFSPFTATPLLKPTIDEFTLNPSPRPTSRHPAAPRAADEVK